MQDALGLVQVSTAPSGVRGQQVPVPLPPARGEAVEVLDLSGGPTNGSWTVGIVRAEGAVPGTVNLHLPAAPAGKQDRSGVSADLLRKFRFSYAVGDLLEVWASSGVFAGGWAPCRVTSQGPLPETYGVHVPAALPDEQDIDGIPVNFLRPLDMSQQALAFERHAGGRLSTGDEAEVHMTNGPHAGSWLPCTVLGPGTGPSTYDVLVPLLGPAGQELLSVHFAALRPHWHADR